jgi:hypothetical protein
MVPLLLLAPYWVAVTQERELKSPGWFTLETKATSQVEDESQSPLKSGEGVVIWARKPPGLDAIGFRYRGGSSFTTCHMI